MIVNIEEFKKALNLELKGFVNTNDYTNYGEVYSKIVNEAIVYIDFRLNKGCFDGISAVICFPQVELIVKELCLKFNLNYHKLPMTVAPTLLQNSSDYLFGINTTALQTSLTKQNLPQVASLVNEYLTLSYQPFWEKYSSLQVVNDEIIDKIDQMKLSDYIPFMMDLKKMIIMKICNNVRYNEYIKWLDSTWDEDAKTIDITKDSYYLAYCELKEILMK